MQNPDASKRLLKWAIDFCQFDNVFKSKASIKWQAFADFMIEFANTPEVEAWPLFSHQREYETLLVGLCLAKEMQVKRLSVRSDFQLVVSQVNGSFTARELAILWLR
ncbi:Ribonuclease H [Abeliophyllum distichum]|uniref:Ribonuclease H n=1 Tax=Abeliophyllum distichum TaxID=126358 RepID=A0ABD1SD85_9LAMI